MRDDEDWSWLKPGQLVQGPAPDIIGHVVSVDVSASPYGSGPTSKHGRTLTVTVQWPDESRTYYTETREFTLMSNEAPLKDLQIIQLPDRSDASDVERWLANDASGAP